jgi:hypothetical protein
VTRSARPVNWRLEIRRALLGLGLGCLLMPVLVFAFGRLLLGPFEGTVGSFLATIYGDALHGRPAAIALFVGPYGLYAVATATLRVAARAGRVTSTRS